MQLLVSTAHRHLIKHHERLGDMDQRDNPGWTYSERATLLTSSAIREILKITQHPDVISFAGGLPSPHAFPLEAIHSAFDRVLTRQGQAALQYGPTEGYAPLRAWIAEDLNRRGGRISPDEVLIVSGSQQGLDLLGKILIDPKSKVAVETPSYLGALQAFGLYQPEFVLAPCDDEGLVPEALDAELARGARFLYVLPNFQNPTGRTLTRVRREALVARAAHWGLPIVEDDPYGDLRYAGEHEPGIYTFAQAAGACVIRLGSFSKILAPGLRLGYIAAPRELIAKLVQAKQASDLHTATLTQMAVHEIVQSDLLAHHLPVIQALYRTQCEIMLAALAKHFPKTAKWTRPQGGMFIWVELAPHIDSTHLLAQSIARGVAFVPGAPFYAVSPKANTLRLSFATVPEAQIKEGIKRLGKLL